MLVEFANSPTSAMTISITSSNTIANSNWNLVKYFPEM
jgi:hypothetical protein